MEQPPKRGLSENQQVGEPSFTPERDFRIVDRLFCWSQLFLKVHVRSEPPNRRDLSPWANRTDVAMNAKHIMKTTVHVARPRDSVQNLIIQLGQH